MLDRDDTPRIGMLAAPHPFAKFVAILGRGKTKQRHLTLEESAEAMGMILRGEALPEQIGAFLMLLRLKEEAPSEIAGFTLGVRATLDLPAELPKVDLDWSSYAGKRLQLPWFLLSALTLAQSGRRVFMHGAEGHTPGRIYTRAVLEYFGLKPASSLTQAAERLRSDGFAYAPLEAISPTLRRLIELRPIFGLRSPVHSFSRMINPFSAPVMINGIFHRGFMEIHSGAARLLHQPSFAVFRGEGGEIERRPNKPTEVWFSKGGEEPVVEDWPATLGQGHQPADENMDPARLLRVWKGEDQDAYAVAAVTGTLAIALRAMGRAASAAEAEAAANRLWLARDRAALPVR